MKKLWLLFFIVAGSSMGRGYNLPDYFKPSPCTSDMNNYTNRLLYLKRNNIPLENDKKLQTYQNGMQQSCKLNP